MRITNTVIQQNAVANLQSGLQRLTQAQIQASTLQKYQSFSDDPQAQSSVMQSAGQLRALEQYSRNINDAQARSNLEDSVLSQTSDILDRVKEIATQQGTATATAQTRLGAKAEVDNLLQTLVGLGNTTYAGSYVFGGDNVTDPPLSGSTPPFYTSAAAPTGHHQTEIAEGQLFAPTHNASELFLDTGVLKTLSDLSTALGNNDASGISTAISSLNSSTTNVQSLVGDIGARVNRLDSALSANDTATQNITTYKSNLDEMDAGEAYTNYTIQQTAYQAAMLATTRVLSLSLTDYLNT